MSQDLAWDDLTGMRLDAGNIKEARKKEERESRAKERAEAVAEPSSKRFRAAGMEAEEARAEAQAGARGEMRDGEMLNEGKELRALV